MIVNVRSGSGGFANYTIEGTELKARNKEKIEIVGDPFFTEKIAEQQGTGYFKILVSPEKKLTNEEMHEILNEAVENIFVGFKKDEYNYSAVLHQDTEKSHWHIIVPKQNLLTHQQLRLYMHDIDTKRYKAIQDTIALNHNLLTMKEAKKILADTKETTYEKNSTKPIQYAYNLVKNDDKKLAQQQVKELIKNNIDTVNSINDIKELIHKNTDLKVVTDNGYNRKNDFHYITVQDKNSKKTSVRGELFNKDFFKQPKQEQRDQLQINHKSYTEVEKELLKKKIRSDLRRENEKRFKVVQNYGRKLKLSIRQEQREVNNKIRKEKNDTTRTNATPSPSRSQRSTSTKPTNNDYARERENRARERESRKRAREERIARYSKHNNRTAETDTRSLAREYKQQQIREQRERHNRGVIERLFSKISEVTRQFFIKIRKIEVDKTIPKTAQNKEKTKLLEALQDTNANKESNSTQESRMNKEDLEEKWEKLVKSAKKLTDNNPKFS